MRKDKLIKSIFAMILTIVLISGCIIAFDLSEIFRKIFSIFSIITIFYWCLLIIFFENNKR